MEPLSALSVATAVCQFLDFTAKIVSGAWKIYNSDAGRDSDRMSYLRTITEDLTRLNDDIRSSIQQQTAQPIDPKDAAILELGEKCDEIGHRLIDALNRLHKRANPKRKQAWDSFRIAILTVWSAGDVEALKQDLQSYRQQITMQLIVSQRDLISDANHRQMKAINVASSSQLQATNDNTNLLSQILDKLDKLDRTGQYPDILTAVRHAYGSGAPGIMSATSLSKVNQILESNDTSKVSQLVLHKLHFKEIDHRYERVAPAHQKTFEWLFLTPTQDEKWASYSDWLRNDTDPLYWITGKAGAGKSTLMRFVLDHPQTHNLLEDWSRGKPLLKAFFFFWNSGTPMQMSYEGMVRSLLYQILEQAPKLIPVAFPYRVLDGMLFGTFIFGQESWSWSWDELMEAFKRVIHQSTKAHKIAVFIDGMDEFQGKPTELIDFVKRLQVPEVKICASSRPWNQFQDAFGHGPHLRVERLTADDIEIVVRSRLSRSAAFSDYEKSGPGFSASLIEEVCQKSEGVFLWVHLVSESLFEGLTDGERPTDLQKRLGSLPTDLEELFGKILGGLDPWHAERSSQLFQIHRASLRPLTLLDMSFADEDDPCFAINAKRKVLTTKEANSRAALMKRRINACTKGLLEADPHETREPANVEVNFLHRTVRDYLERVDIWEKMCATAPASFSCHVQLCNSYIMRLKGRFHLLAEKALLGDKVMLSYCTSITMAGFEYATRGTKDHAALGAKLLEALEEVHANLMNEISPERSASLFLRSIESRINKLLEVAIRCDMFAYLIRGFSSIPKDLQSKGKSESLFTAISDNYDSDQLDLPNLRLRPSPRLVHFFLDSGADPNFRPGGSLMSTWEHVLKVATYHNNSYDKAEICAILEDFVLFGADLGSKQLAQYLKETTNDTTRLRELIRQKKKEEHWKQKGRRIFSHFSRR